MGLLDVGENFVNKAIVKIQKLDKKKNFLRCSLGYIGNEPKTDLFKDYIKLNNMGYTATDHNMETNIKVYVAGDVRKGI